MACFKLRTDEVICFLYKQEKKKYRWDIWQRSVNKLFSKWATMDTTQWFSFETVFQHIEVIIDRDDSFSFPLLPLRGIHKCFLFHFTLFFRKQSEKSNRKCDSSFRRFPGLVYRNNRLYFFYLLSLSLSLSLSSQSVFSFSLCEVWASCCFPCVDYNNVFWHRLVSCSPLLCLTEPPASSEQQSSNTQQVATFFFCP